MHSESTPPQSPGGAPQPLHFAAPPPRLRLREEPLAPDVPAPELQFVRPPRPVELSGAVVAARTPLLARLARGGAGLVAAAATTGLIGSAGFAAADVLTTTTPAPLTAPATSSVPTTPGATVATTDTTTSPTTTATTTTDPAATTATTTTAPATTTPAATTTPTTAATTTTAPPATATTTTDSPGSSTPSEGKPTKTTTITTTTTTTTKSRGGSPTSGHGSCPATKRRVRRAAHRRATKAQHVVCPSANGQSGHTTHTHGHGHAGARHHAHKHGHVHVPAPLVVPPSEITPLIGGGGGSAFAAPVWTDPLSPAQLAQYDAFVGRLSVPPRWLERMYRQAARKYGLPWQVLAAINYIETGYGRDLRVSSAGAVGFMQFMPATWAQYGVHVDAAGHFAMGTPDPWQPRDAIFSAARYLVANGAPRNLAKAIYGYNHAGWYVQEVLSVAAQIDTHGLRRKWKAHRKLAAMRTMARLLNGMPYVWGGGHATWTINDGYDCSGFVSSVLHAGGFLRLPVTTQSLPSQPSMRAGRGRWVTIYDRTDGGSLQGDHVIIRLGKQWWESGGGGLSGAPRVHRIWHMSPGYLQTFNLVLHPKGL